MNNIKTEFALGERCVCLFGEAGYSYATVVGIEVMANGRPRYTVKTEFNETLNTNGNRLRKSYLY